jgi:GTP-binding protein
MAAATAEEPAELAVAPHHSIRNVAIIAHVDHGKTTMVDRLLSAAGSGISDGDGQDRVMDGGPGGKDLERERGITIMSKVTRVEWQGLTINIVDTPGHQDFGGEVERILSMVDGVVLVVDAAEGPMSQTKFVLKKALAAGSKPVVVVNKADRADALQRLEENTPDNEIFDLFMALDANDEQLEFPTLYASGKAGWAVESVDTAVEACRGGWDVSKSFADTHGLTALLEAIRDHVPCPAVEDPAVAAAAAGPGGGAPEFAMASTMLSWDTFVGQLVTGKVHRGSVKVGDKVDVISLEGGARGTGRVAKLFHTHGAGDMREVASASAGDIVTLAPGFDGVQVADTVGSAGVSAPIQSVALDPPTISMRFGVNDSPLGGKVGKFVTASAILGRLQSEVRNNVALQLTTDGDSGMEVHGRGELQLSILVEEMRRESYEFSLSPPRVIMRTCPLTDKKQEPYEEATIDVELEYAGGVISGMSTRGGQMLSYDEQADNVVRLVFNIPSRGLLGYRAELNVNTHGGGLLFSRFDSYKDHFGALPQQQPGKLVCMADGVATGYALNMIKVRGDLFIKPGDSVYAGMIVGEHAKDNDLDVNATREKALDNMRTTGADEKVELPTPRKFSLEDLLTYLSDDEMVEVTPDALRLRFVERDSKTRQRLRKQKVAQQNQLKAKRSGKK